MKLQFLKGLLCAAIVLFFSCSDDSTPLNSNRPSIPEPSTRSIQVKKITEILYPNSFNPDISEYNFVYNGNQVVAVDMHDIDDNFYHSELIYDGSKLTGISTFSNDVQTNMVSIGYQGRMLSLYSDPLEGFSAEYLYVNGDLNIIKYYDLVDGLPVLGSTEQFLYQSGNVIQKTITETGFPSSTISYTYDQNRNPLSGMNQYLRLLFGTEGFDGFSYNNPLTSATLNPGNPNPTLETYLMQYNANHYPTSIKRLDSNGTVICDTSIEYR